MFPHDWFDETRNPLEVCQRLLLSWFVLQMSNFANEQVSGHFGASEPEKMVLVEDGVGVW